jgi:hypothetical protein
MNERNKGGKEQKISYRRMVILTGAQKIHYIDDNNKNISG